MKTFRQHKARLIARARRRSSSFTNAPSARALVEVAPPREALFGASEPLAVRAPQEPAFVPAPPGISDRELPVPAALSADFVLPMPEAFGRVVHAAKRLIPS